MMEPRQRAFTLIELLAVIMIITILVSVVIGTTGYARRKTDIARTRAEIAALETALDAYRADQGFYPALTDTTVWPAACTNGGSWSSVVIYRALTMGSKVYLSLRPEQLSVPTNHVPTMTTMVDPFAGGYRYRCPGTRNPASFDLWSDGPDRKINTTDDITNWGS